MNSHQTSDGKRCRFKPFLLLSMTGLLALLTAGCQTVYRDSMGVKSDLYQEEVSLKPQQLSIEKMRQSIPEDKRVRNDEIKEILSLLNSDFKFSPNKARDRFNKVQRNRREKFRKEARRTRDQYSKDERKARDDFLKDLKKKRADYKSRSYSREKNKEFYDNQDAKRKSFLPINETLAKSLNPFGDKRAKTSTANSESSRKSLMPSLGSTPKSTASTKKRRRPNARTLTNRVSLRAASRVPSIHG